MYQGYIQELLADFQNGRLDADVLARSVDGALAVHVFGFGRSGTAALALAIRLRHFLAPDKQVFWLGDSVRDPIREGDLVILVSRSGAREEVLHFMEKARSARASCFAITAAREGPLFGGSSHAIILPVLGEGSSYGGGDFELAAWIFQEVFLTYYGRSRHIPEEKVWMNHV
ncbi:MAG: SIS domain-containing protein [Methanolinea sp.]|nr:SIS domain-containing protein [Methanolinea sp.]